MPGDKSYNELLTLLKNHFNPAPSEIVQWFKFQSRSRQTVAIFVAELRLIAQRSNFGNSLNKLLRDRVVCRIEKSLTFEKALEIAISKETAKKSVNVLQGAGPSEVHKIVNIVCYRCGKGHTADKCRLKGAKCFNCGKIGHIQRSSKAI